MIAVVGSLNLDLVVPAPHHPVPGETVLGGDLARHPGGKGANQAVAAARLGVPVTMVGRVGDDGEGATLVAALGEAGVDTAQVTRTPGVATGHALVTVDPEGENTIVVSPGANSRLGPVDCERAAATLGAAAVTVLQQEVPDEVNHAAARLATGTVLHNPAPAAAGATVPPGVDLLVPNRTELATLTGRAVPRSLDEVAAAARRLTGPGAVLVTLGGDGVLLVEGGASLHVPACSVAPVDTTAAGDAFCGALAVALAEGRKLEDAARWASAAAAVSTTRRGAQPSLPHRAEVRELLAGRHCPGSSEPAPSTGT